MWIPRDDKGKELTITADLLTKNPYDNSRIDIAFDFETLKDPNSSR
jgi:hypothetical protein